MTSTLIATITGVDANSEQPITRGIGSPSLAGAVGELSSYQNLSTAAVETTLQLPATTVYCIYIKNLNGVGAGKTLSIKGTPTGGVEAVLAKLSPGGVFIYWQTVNSEGGYTSLKLTPEANDTPFEIFLGA